MQNRNDELQNLRSQIDQIHMDLGRLFQQRLQLNLQIWKIKNTNELPLIDSKRENELIHQFDHFAKNENETIALQNFFKVVLSESKSFTVKELK